MGGTSRNLSLVRASNILCRTAHIGVAGVLFGGHVFGVERERLVPWLYLVILSGSVLLLLEAYPSWRWVFQGRAMMIFGKLLLLCLVPGFWSYRVALLIAVIVVGSVGSHMPRWFRYYSLVDGRYVGDAKYSVALNSSPCGH